MIKRIICIMAALMLVLSSSVLPVSANSAEPEAWQLAYFEALKEYYYGPDYANQKKISRIPSYAFVDFNQDGMLELIINPGPHGFDSPFRMKIYSYANGELRQFNEGSNGLFGSPPDGYRNKRTGELKWIYPSSDMPEDIHGSEEMLFDFDTYQIAFAEIPLLQEVRNCPNRVEWTLDGEKISKKQYENAAKEWERSHELVIPIDAYYDYRNCPSSIYQDYQSYDDVWQKMLEVIKKAPTLDSTRVARRSLLWVAVVFGGLAVVAAAIVVPISLAKKRRA